MEIENPVGVCAENCIDSLPVFPNRYKPRRRDSVSAEASILNLKPEKLGHLEFGKSPDTTMELLKAVAQNFLFVDMDISQKLECIAFMNKKDVKASDVLIREGEEGDNFYIITAGIFDVIKQQCDHSEKVVFTYDNQGAFGELALMYNCPRAATVKARTDGTLWSMDRALFRASIMRSHVQKRQQFVSTLETIDLFASFTPIQRSNIADCLVLESVKENEVIFTEGDLVTSTSKFYIIKEGSINCYNSVEGKKILLHKVTKGGFIGELAQSHSPTRKMTCVANTSSQEFQGMECWCACSCQILAIGRDAFERLIGPAEHIFKNNPGKEEHHQSGK